MTDKLRSASQKHNAAELVFRAMHGFYGQLWLGKFATGRLTENRDDEGVVSAKNIWSYALQDFTEDVVKSAIRLCLEKHLEYPPNLPQFVSLCTACVPRRNDADQHGCIAYLPLPDPPDVRIELQHDGKDWARRILAQVDLGHNHTHTVKLFAKQVLGILK